MRTRIARMTWQQTMQRSGENIGWREEAKVAKPNSMSKWRRIVK